MAALHVLSPLGLALRRPATPVAARRAYPQAQSLRIAAAVSMALCTAIARSLLCLWAIVALGFSLLVLVGLFLG